MKKLVLLLVISSFVRCTDPTIINTKEYLTIFETSDGKQSAPYFKGIAWWKELDQDFAELHITEFGMTDAGYPLHIVTLCQNGLTLDKIKGSNKSIILINNAIHPGEPDGVDASMLLFRDILKTKKELLDSCILVCIPYYNIGGAINRNSHSRANQNGPEEYGFRGNAQNLDLNRDFVKCDSKNAESFAQLLQYIDPDFYIETHVSNGADYQYTITYLSTQPTKLGYAMGTYLADEIIPSLEAKMKDKKQEMVPYVNVHGDALDSSYTTFYDSPKYSSGLTTLNNIYGFITETHMLKPFDKRVQATYQYLESSIEFCNENTAAIKNSRGEQKRLISGTSNYAIDWNLDSAKSNVFAFNGYEYGYKPSEVTGEQRLYYDRSKPKTWKMYFYYAMKPTVIREKPKAYFLRKGFTDVEDRLTWNGVILESLKNDTTIEIISYRISNYETGQSAYEKHYGHYNTTYIRDTIKWQFRKGDFRINLGTDKDRFVVEMLEPDAPDSYFNWNFFDAILQQKEWYSGYVFEDVAAQLLRTNPNLKAEFEDKKKNDEGFANNPRSQLTWVYHHSENYEKEHMRLPVFRLE
jgi:hypothetical protein